MTTPIETFKTALNLFITDNVSQQRYDICSGCDAFSARDNRCKLSNCDMTQSVGHLEYRCPANKFDSVRLEF